MRRIYQILVPLLSLFLVRVDLTDMFPLKYQVQLLELLDADTAVVGLGKRRLKVRFSKIDAPEKGQPFLRAGGDAGNAARNCALRIIGQQRIFQLKIYKQDIYGRILGELDDLSFRFVEKGCVSLYPHAEFASKAQKFTFVRAQQLARRRKLGLWSRGGYLQPKLWRKKSRRQRSY